MLILDCHVPIKTYSPFSDTAYKMHFSRLMVHRNSLYNLGLRSSHASISKCTGTPVGSSRRPNSMNSTSLGADNHIIQGFLRKIGLSLVFLAHWIFCMALPISWGSKKYSSSFPIVARPVDSVAFATVH